MKTVFKNKKMNLKSNAVIILSILAAGFLSSCADQHKAEIKQGFDKSVSANAQAKSHVEWEASPNNSVKIFTHLREDYLKIDNEEKKVKYQRSVCDGLFELSISNLMVFQDELNKPENADVIGANCQTKILARINEKTEDQISKFEYKTDPTDLKLINPIDFKLETKVVELNEVLTTKEMIAQLQDGEIVLTFDDGPDGVATDSILSTLKSAGDVKAMFFTKGANIVQNPRQIRHEFKAGHIVD
jgi:hypothetical protein